MLSSILVVVARITCMRLRCKKKTRRSVESYIYICYSSSQQKIIRACVQVCVFANSGLDERGESCALQTSLFKPRRQPSPGAATLAPPPPIGAHQRAGAHMISHSANRARPLIRFPRVSLVIGGFDPRLARRPLDGYF